MKEYNWRQEREKFRPDFQKREPQNSSAAVQTPVRWNGTKWSILAGIIVVAALAAAGVFMFKKDSSATFAEIAEKNKTAVGLVTLIIESREGVKKAVPIGTAWAFSENRFATNAHVALGLKKALNGFIENSAMLLLAQKHNCKTAEELAKKLGPNAETEKTGALKYVMSIIKDVRADIIINTTQKQSYTISHVQIHKDYGSVDSKVVPDVAVLTIDGKHDNFFKLADMQDFKNLKSGVPIAFLGFPMENLAGDNVNLNNPVASMQSGIVVAVSDFEMKDAGYSGNILLRHNLPAAGGASGSPIFNQDGRVVALLFGGNTIGQTRDPSGAQINFGIRVDLLQGVAPQVEFKEFLLQ